MDNTLQDAADLAAAGQRAKARQIVERLLRQDPNNAEAWVLLSRLVDDREQEITCLKCALELDLDQTLREWATTRLEKLSQPSSRKVDTRPRQGCRLMLWGLIGAVAGLVAIGAGAALFIGSGSSLADLRSVFQGPSPIFTPTSTPIASSTPSLVGADTPMPTPTPTPQSIPIVEEVGQIVRSDRFELDGVVPGDYFAGNLTHPVAMSGANLAVGAPLAAVDQAGGVGEVWLFNRFSDIWDQYRIASPEPAENGHFGATVALSGDTLAVGAPGELVNGQPVGVIYIYVRAGSDWVQEARFPSPGGLERGFGYTLALSKGRLAAATIDDTIYIYERQQDNTWIEQPMPYPPVFESNPWPEQLVLEGDTLLVSFAPPDIERVDNAPAVSGIVYIYQRPTDNSAWVQRAALSGSEGELDGFGWAVDLDGRTIAVTSSPHATTRQVHIYEDHSPSNDWSEIVTFSLDYPAQNASNRVEWLGAAVSLDGGTLVVGGIADRAVCGDACIENVFYWRGGDGWSTGPAYPFRTTDGSSTVASYSAVSGDWVATVHFQLTLGQPDHAELVISKVQRGQPP
jgi:hypothetical protein